MGLTDKHLFYGDDIPQTITEKEQFLQIKNLEEQIKKLEETANKLPERKVGEWEQKYMTEEEWIRGVPSTVCPFCHKVNHNGRTRYCPHCGEMMEVDDA